MCVFRGGMCPKTRGLAWFVGWWLNRCFIFVPDATFPTIAASFCEATSTENWTLPGRSSWVGWVGVIGLERTTPVEDRTRPKNHPEMMLGTSSSEKSSKPPILFFVVFGFHMSFRECTSFKWGDFRWPFFKDPRGVIWRSWIWTPVVKMGSPCKMSLFRGGTPRMYAKTQVSFHFSSLELGVPWGWINSNFSFQVSWCDRGCFWKFFVNEPRNPLHLGTRAGMTWWFLSDLSGSIACHDDYGLCFLLDSWGTGSCRLQVIGYIDTTKSLPLPQPASSDSLFCSRNMLAWEVI